MSSGYPNQPPYPGVAFPALQPPAALPDQPRKPWPLRTVNRWMTIGAVAITLLALVLAVVASQVVSKPPSTAGMKLVYQSSLTQNSSGSFQWDESGDCQFTDSGYVTSAPGANQPAWCRLQNSAYQDFTLKVRVVYASGVALIGFWGDNWLEIFGTGRYYFYNSQTPLTAAQQSQASLGFGSAALHPSDLGVSDRANDIIIQVQGTTYTFYGNGQLLTTYTASALESPDLISLGAAGGDQAEFSDMSIYTPS